MSDAKKEKKPEAGGREGKTMIGAYVSKDALWTLQELLAKESRQQGEKVTMQDFILLALRSECSKRNVKIDL